MSLLYREETVGESFSILIRILPNSYTRKMLSFGRVKTLRLSKDNEIRWYHEISSFG